MFLDEKAPAQHELDPKRTTVIFIDDRASNVPSMAVRLRIAKTAETELLSAKVLTADLISSDSIIRATAAERFGKPRSISELGRAVQADVVIWATVDQFSLSPDGAVFAPQGTMRVKVIDAVKDERLWPEDERQDMPIAVDLPQKPGGPPRRAADQAAAHQELADALGKRLARMFFKHNVRDANPNIGR